MAASDWTMQRLADILDAPVDRPTVLETTALGAAYLAGLQSGFYPEPERFAERWALDRRFSPNLAAPERERLLARWHDAVRRTLSR
jgi:glycerol kinase